LKVSALIPTYNRRTQVLRAIDSVFAQTVGVDEIVVVDDGSTDGTAEAIRSRYGKRVILLRQENAGVSAARNRGIREAAGEWIAFLDSDDVWLPRKLERQFAALEMFAPECGACFTDCTFVGDPNITCSAHSAAGLKTDAEFFQIEDIRYYLLGGPPVMYTQSLLVRRALVQDHDGFDPAMPISEDLDLLFRLTFKTNFCFVADHLVQIDRAPSRPIPLTGMYASREDRKYESLKWLYTKWLALPEVAGTAYERRVRGLLREVFFDSIEAKLHNFRMGPALREIVELQRLGTSYIFTTATLFSRKLEKLHRRLRAAVHPPARPDAN